jgi:4-nitrophenyl phosphatase
MENTKIKAMILDMDGVIWRDKQPIGDLSRIFNTLEARGIKFVFATNNSINTVDKYVELLIENGIKTLPEQIFTSATATSKFLKALHPEGGNVFVVGMSGLEKTLEHDGFHISAEKPVAVVVGLDRTLTYQKMRTATLLIRAGTPFIGTNPDRTFPSPDGLIPGAGSMLAAIQAATDIQPEIIGKPKATMFNQALEYLGEKPENVLVVGDRLETDIAGGQAANCKCAVVLTGVSTREMAESWQPKVDLIAKDLQSLIDII